MLYGECPWHWPIGEQALAYNFMASPKKYSMTLDAVLVLVWIGIASNCFFIERFQILNDEKKSNYHNLIEDRIQDKSPPSISLERLNRFLTQFSTWVPLSLRIQKIDINPGFIKVYGRVDDEQIFSTLWKQFKSQDWVHQLRLLKWELHSSSRWFFAFQVNM